MVLYRVLYTKVVGATSCEGFLEHLFVGEYCCYSTEGSGDVDGEEVKGKRKGERCGRSEEEGEWKG